MCEHTQQEIFFEKTRDFFFEKTRDSLWMYEHTHVQMDV